MQPQPYNFLFGFNNNVTIVQSCRTNDNALLRTCASITNINALHPPNIASTSKAKELTGSRKSNCPGVSQIENYKIIIVIIEPCF